VRQASLTGFTEFAPYSPVNAIAEKQLKNSRCRILVPLSSKVTNRFLAMFRVTKILNRFENRIRIEGPFSDLIPILL
jgi:hypothetical protein